mmetsp:Transcript_43780/g.118115  ORF Transcript_43780/g.118115 Transcript_43780/m.118115 type:complete len:241 (+) Transcript_43780:59-781(+)
MRLGIAVRRPASHEDRRSGVGGDGGVDARCPPHVLRLYPDALHGVGLCAPDNQGALRPERHARVVTQGNDLRHRHAPVLEVGLDKGRVGKDADLECPLAWSEAELVGHLGARHPHLVEGDGGFRRRGVVDGEGHIVDGKAEGRRPHRQLEDGDDLAVLRHAPRQAQVLDALRTELEVALPVGGGPAEGGELPQGCLLEAPHRCVEGDLPREGLRAGGGHRRPAPVDAALAAAPARVLGVL